MKKLLSPEIREIWIRFFENKSHLLIESASLIPINDPTLLWINSGVAALKKYFDGSVTPPSRRITNIQKCIRTNDIDNVGRTDRHHTFFEMLGNFSIGDYFRKEAITYGFELLTSQEYFGIPINKLYITYHPSDLETKKLWKSFGFQEEQLIPIEGNFWEIGEGPSGPNTEIFFDRGERYDPERLGVKLLTDEIDNDRYIEIWNIVFSQYNADPKLKREEYKELPQKNIDTGAGFERLACIFQETDSNFETDLFLPLIKALEQASKLKYQNHPMSFRVIIDHIRACVFALSDGESFSKDGRGYVLRRLLRRAMVYALKLNLQSPILHSLVPIVVQTMSYAYPALIKHQNRVTQLIKDEEEKFMKTLDKGLDLLNNALATFHTIDGAFIFKLYDTYGFPLEITKEILLEKGIKVDEEGFKEHMKIQKELARSSRKIVSSMNKQTSSYLDFRTTSSYLDVDDVVSHVIGLFKDNERVPSLNEEGVIVLEQTNFYAESGGQVSDVGYLVGKDFEAEVTAVFKGPNKQHFHLVKIIKGSVAEKDPLMTKVNLNRKNLIRRNHSATHLLQAAINQVLNKEIKQMGSFVDDQGLRFDFSSDLALSLEEQIRIEKEINQNIASAIPLTIKTMPLAEAKKTHAKAFFENKYEDVVRVVTIGSLSAELCGGSHVNNTQEIGIFKIISEASIASGVRRIEAKTSLEAYNYSSIQEEQLRTIAINLGVKSPVEIDSKLTNQLKQLEEKNQEITFLQETIISSLKEALLNSRHSVNEINHYYLESPLKMESLKMLLDYLKNESKTIILLISKNGGKNSFILNSSSDLANSKEVFELLKKDFGLVGGGKPTFVQGSLTMLSPKLRQRFNEVL